MSKLRCCGAAAAKVLKAHEGELQGTVKLMFQPAEEGGAGAKLMVDEGAMAGVDAVFGMHVWPSAPSGTIQTRVNVAGGVPDTHCLILLSECDHMSIIVCKALSMWQLSLLLAVCFLTLHLLSRMS